MDVYNRDQIKQHIKSHSEFQILNSKELMNAFYEIVAFHLMIH